MWLAPCRTSNTSILIAGRDQHPAVLQDAHLLSLSGEAAASSLWNPFDPQVRRMVLAVLTSGGKTLLAQLLAVEQLDRTDRAVCYVAPTRSLCREARQAMSEPVRILQKESGADQPDFPTPWSWPHARRQR